MNPSEVGFREHCKRTGIISYTDLRKEQPKSSTNRKFSNPSRREQCHSENFSTHRFSGNRG